MLRRHIEALAAAQIEAGQHVVHTGHVGAGLLEFFVVFRGQPWRGLVLLHPSYPADGEVALFPAVGTGVGGWLGFLGLVVKNAVGAAASPAAPLLAAAPLLTTALLASPLLPAPLVAGLAPARASATALVAGTAATAAPAASVTAATTTTASPAPATSSVVVHVSSRWLRAGQPVDTLSRPS